MPTLPYYYLSNFYLVKMNWVEYFNYFSIPTRGVNGYMYFIASKFEKKLANGATAKQMIQGGPGVAVQDIPTPYYTYTIEAPLIINNFDYNNVLAFAPYNCLNYFAMQMINFQWAALQGYDSGQTLDTSKIYENNIAVTKYEIRVTESSVTQVLEIISTVELSASSATSIEISASTIASSPDVDQVMSYIGRMVRNYDIYSNLLITPYPATFEGPSYYLQSSDNEVFLDSCDISINFAVDPKYFLNTGNVVTFMMKNYTVSQTFGIKGFSYLPVTDDFTPGEFHYRNTLNTAYLGPPSMGNYIFQTELPMIVKSKSLNFNSDQLLTTVFDFSFYKSQYSAQTVSDLVYWDLGTLS